MKCVTCNEEIPKGEMGLDGVQCLECWESYCARAWWELTGKLQDEIEVDDDNADHPIVDFGDLGS